MEKQDLSSKEKMDGSDSCFMEKTARFPIIRRKRLLSRYRQGERRNDLNREHKKFIKKHLKDGEKLLHRQDTWEILDALDYLMLYEGFGSDDEPTDGIGN